MATYIRREFDASVDSVSEAREFLRDALAGRGDAADDLELVLSELATNAVRHAGTPFEVVVETDGRLRLEVEDGSSDTPVPQPESSTADHGRGLGIVDAVCDRWGVHMTEDRKCVWCERDLI